MKGVGPAPAGFERADSGGEGPWLSNDGFLFDPASGFTYSTNEVGTLVFRMLTQRRALTDVVDAVVARFEVDSATVRADIEEFVAQLRAAGLR